MKQNHRFAVISLFHKRVSASFIKWLEREEFVYFETDDEGRHSVVYIDVEDMTWTWNNGNEEGIGDTYITTEEFKTIWRILKRSWYRHSWSMSDFKSLFERGHATLESLNRKAERELRRGEYKLDRFDPGEGYRCG